MAYSKVKYKQNILIEALEKSLGVVTTACKNTGIPRDRFYEWYKLDPDFKRRVDDIENIAIDFAESQLHKQIKEGEVTATIFYLKTKGKKRGYVEKTETDITSGGQPINFNPIIWVDSDEADKKE